MIGTADGEFQAIRGVFHGCGKNHVRISFADALDDAIATHHVRTGLPATRDKGAIGDPETHGQSPRW